MAKLMQDARKRDAGLWLTLLLGALVLLNYVDRGAVGIAAPKLKDELLLSATAFGIAVSAFSWVYAPAQFAVGWLSDRFCVYRLIGAGLAVWALATFLTGFADGLAMLVGLRVMLGIGEGVAFPSASKIIARHVTPERRGVANSVLAAALAWGPALGTFAGGWILNYYGWRPIFILFGSVTLLWLIPWLLVSRPHWRGYAHGSGNNVPVGQVMRNRTVWAMGIGHFCNTYGFYFLLAWLPLFLVKVRHLSILEMTGMMTTAYVVQGFGALAWGSLSDRLVTIGWDEGRVRKGLMCIYLLASAVAILGIGFSTSASGNLRLAFTGRSVRWDRRVSGLRHCPGLRRARGGRHLGRGDERRWQYLRHHWSGADRAADRGYRSHICPRLPSLRRSSALAASGGGWRCHRSSG